MSTETTTTTKSPTCDERIDAHLDSRAKAFRAFMAADDLDAVEIDGDTLAFYNYGLCFDYVEPATYPDQRCGYYRYQLSYGGPSDEIRFYPHGKISYWFLDWFDGAARTVTDEDWARWLRDWFGEVGMIDWKNVELY